MRRGFILRHGAGGSLTDRFGNPTHEHETAISTNRLLHEIVLAELRT